MPVWRATVKNLVNHNTSQKYVPALRPKVVTQQCLRHSYAREELISRLTERRDFGNLRGHEVRKSDRRRRFKPNAVTTEVEMGGLSRVQRCDSSDRLASEFDAIMIGEVHRLCRDELG